MTKQPNILWICTDQQRYDTIGALGNPHVRTPNLVRLCAEGTAFTHAYCQSPICTPSRDDELRRGGKYRENFPIEYHQATWCTDRTIDFFRDQAGTPWLCSINVLDPHPPL